MRSFKGLSLHMAMRSYLVTLTNGRRLGPAIVSATMPPRLFALFHGLGLIQSPSQIG